MGLDQDGDILCRTIAKVYDVSCARLLSIFVIAFRIPPDSRPYPIQRDNWQLTVAWLASFHELLFPTRDRNDFKECRRRRR